MSSFYRQWINQPSALQPFHHLHGALVIRTDTHGDYAHVAFIDGETVGGLIPKICLSDGWPAHLIPNSNQKPVMAKETGKDGVLAAAKEIYNERFHWSPVMSEIIREFEAIIAKHCVDRATAETRLAQEEKRDNTEKARADNLQAELSRLEDKLAQVCRAADYYRESRDELVKKLIEG